MHATPRRLVTALLATGAILTTGLLAGCTGGSGGSSAGGGYAASGGGDAGASSASGDTAAKTASSGAAGGSATTGDRSVVTAGDLDLTAADPISTAHAISTIVTGDGGRVQSLNEQPKGQASADLTVRIPSSVFDAALTAIEHRATVRSVSIHSADVTTQVTDYGVRIANLRTSIGRLQTLLATATDTTALVEIESSLTTRQTDLEQLLAQQKDLTDQVSFATLGITIESPAVVRATGPGTFVAGFLAGLQGLGSTLAALAVIAGVLLPWVVVVGLVTFVAWWGVRLVRRRRRTAPSPGA